MNMNDIIKCNECDKFFYVGNVSIDIEYFASCFHHKGLKEIHKRINRDDTSPCALRLDADRRRLLKWALDYWIEARYPKFAIDKKIARELLTELERGE